MANPVRVYRTPQDPDDPALGPCWHWRCQCGWGGNGALGWNDVVGSWRAAYRGARQHLAFDHAQSGAA